jgi:hypothetical protein
MNRRFCKSLSLWIVPLLILRALIPVGFMLAADANGLSLVFCSAAGAQFTAAAAASSQHDEHAGHHAGHEAADSPSQHSGNHAKHASTQHDAPCPFSLAAVAAAGEVPYLDSIAAVATAERFVVLSEPAASAGPLRADRIRGPPPLA